MAVQEHSTIREGLVTGLLGAVVAAVVYLLADIAAGSPLHTFDVLGQVFVQGDLRPTAGTVDAGAVVGALLLHLALFAVAGIILALLAHMAARELSLRMGVWIGVVVSFFFLCGLVYLLSTMTRDRLPLWEIIAGNLAATAAMGWFLLRRHPRLTRPLGATPLGEEAEAPPHPPGAPRR